MEVKKVLIIDGNLFRLETMDLFFKELGHQTYTNSSWEAKTIQEIINISPGVIVIDEKLKGIKGRDIGMILNSVNQLRNVPVMLISEAFGFADIVKRSTADRLFRLA